MAGNLLITSKLKGQVEQEKAEGEAEGEMGKRRQTDRQTDRQIYPVRLTSAVWSPDSLNALESECFSSKHLRIYPRNN